MSGYSANERANVAGVWLTDAVGPWKSRMAPSRRWLSSEFASMHDCAGNKTSRPRRVWATCLALLFTLLLAGCGPPYLSDTYTTSTPKSKSFDTSDLIRRPVVVLAFLTPGNLQGFGPTLSHALSGALGEVVPPIPDIPTVETLNRLTDEGLTPAYADLRAGFSRNGVLDRQLLRRIGGKLGARYVLLPGVAQFEESIIDKVEAVGIKLVRNRVTTLRLWLQLWDSETGHIVWESSGEATTSTVFLSPKQTTALEQLAKRLLIRMIQDGLLESKTDTRPAAGQ